MLGRRRFLFFSLGAIAGAHFEIACSDDDDGAAAQPKPPQDEGGLADAGPPSGDDRFGRLEELRNALRASPDHLHARADALVAAKDPRKIFEFVRDAIRTMPPFAESESPETAVRFGVDSVLRSGSGTPRERAELLAALLVRAGFTAAVVKGDPTGPLFASDARAKVYARAITLPFEPGAPPSGSWEERAKSISPPAREILDPDGAKTDALYGILRPLIPADAAIRVPTLSISTTPLVLLKENGADVLLNPLLPDAEYGRGDVTNPVPAAPMSAPRTMKVRLQITRARAPQTAIDVASDDLRFDEIAGSRLRVSFQPTIPLGLWLKSKPDEITTFLAGLALVRSNGTLLRFTPGSGVSAFGDVVTKGATSTTVSGVPLAAGGNVAAVKSLAVAAVASSFPMVRLDVSPKDANGAVVQGLSGGSFVIQEDGVARTAVMRENGGGARVLILRDGTGSQPAISAALGNTIGNAITSALPGAKVQVRSLDAFGATPADGYTLTDGTAIGSALSTVGGASASLFGGISSGIGSGPTLIIVLSDGDSENVATLRQQCLLACPACPILVIGCYSTPGTIIQEPLEALAKTSGGKFVDAGDLSNSALVTNAISEYGTLRSSSPYRLVYQAPAKGNATRNVSVKAGAEGMTSYTVPAQPAPDSEIIGVHLRIEVGSEIVDRTLAGIPVTAATPTLAEIASATKLVRDFMLGTSWLTFEGSAPTLSAWIDDALGAALGLREVEAKSKAGDREGALAAAANAPIRAPLSSLLAHAPLFDAEHVIETGPRVVLHVGAPIAQQSTTDILPLTRFVAIGIVDDKLAFQATTKASLRLAIAEEAIAKTSTVSLAKGTLQAVGLGTLGDSALPAGVPADARPHFLRQLNRYSDWYRFVVADGSTQAFWAIHGATGSALGVLPDGSGGAVADCKALVDTIESSMDALVFLVQQLEAGYGGAVVAIAAVGKAAAIAIAEAALSFTDPLINPSIWQLGSVLVCDGAKEILGPHIPVPKGGGLPKIAKDYIQNLGADAALGNTSICKASAPCTGTQ